MAIGGVTALMFFFLTGCAKPPVQTITVEKPVLVPGPIQYVPIPPEMFVGCLPPPAAGPTNGGMLLHDHAMTDYAACLQAHLTAIQGLK